MNNLLIVSDIKIYVFNYQICKLEKLKNIMIVQYYIIVKFYFFMFVLLF